MGTEHCLTSSLTGLGHEANWFAPLLSLLCMSRLKGLQATASHLPVKVRTNPTALPKDSYWGHRRILWSFTGLLPVSLGDGHGADAANASKSQSLANQAVFLKQFLIFCSICWMAAVAFAGRWAVCRAMGELHSPPCRAALFLTTVARLQAETSP